MASRDPNIVRSGLSGPITEQGVTVDVRIYRLEEQSGEQSGWSLEVVDSTATSTVWDELFETDELAFTVFRRTVVEEGIGVFVDRGNVIPIRP
jgi:hypothetical protein